MLQISLSFNVFRVSFLSLWCFDSTAQFIASMSKTCFSNQFYTIKQLTLGSQAEMTKMVPNASNDTHPLARLWHRQRDRENQNERKRNRKREGERESKRDTCVHPWNKLNFCPMESFGNPQIELFLWWWWLMVVDRGVDGGRVDVDGGLAVGLGW